MRVSTALYILIFSFPVFAQQRLSRDQVVEDYTILKNILLNAHPSLYAYSSEEKWDSLFSAFEKDEIPAIQNPNQFFRSVSSLADNVKDGHLIVYHPKMDTIPPMFPLLLKIIDNKLYTDTDDSGIPLGAEIISVDNISGHEILNAMLKFAPSDGYSYSKKYRQIEEEFGILHYYEYGAKNNYSVKYKTTDGEVKTVEVSAQPFEMIGMRSAHRNSHFSAYHQQDESADFFRNRIFPRLPFLYFIDSVNTAVLTVNSFGLDPKVFKSELIRLFSEIKKKKAEHLIIDVRQNNGGYRINAIHLFSFLTKTPFKQRISESAITDTIPESEYILDTLSDYRKFFQTYFASALKKNDRWVLTDDHAESEMVPYKKPYKGEVYVLTGGKTFSAATAFALNAKNSPEIINVGEETGGGYYFHTGQYPVLYALPNTKVIIRISLVKINRFVIDETIPVGSGVLPDVEVNLTVGDLIAGRDSQLDYILKRIQKTP